MKRHRTGKQTAGPFRPSALAVVLALSLLPSCAHQVKVEQKLGSFVGRSVTVSEIRTTWEAVRAGGASREEIDLYNAMVADFLVKFAGYSHPRIDQDSMRFASLRGSFMVDFDPAKKGDLDLRSFDQVYVSNFLRVTNGLKQRIVTEGVGAPLALRSPPSDDDPFVPPDGLWRPATAILEFNGSETPRLVIYDPLRRREIRVGNHLAPPRSDFSVPVSNSFIAQLSKTMNIPAMVNFEKYSDRLNFYRASPFDPDKTVCLFIHGLKSSPATWKVTINRLMDDPVVRRNYEFWIYGYPTGAPIPFSAMELRQEIDRMREFRTARGARFNNTVVVGHSLGGLLAKTLTQSSGDENWNKLFSVPVSGLDIPVEDRDLLEEMIYFKSRPCVERVVFIATPHRGTKFADNPIGRLGDGLITLPEDLVRLAGDLLTLSGEALTPLGVDFATKPPSSIDELRTDSAFMNLFMDVPLNPRVRYHSIMGQRWPHRPVEKSSDGVVPYFSAHLEGVDSELVIQSNHGVHEQDEAIEEIARILRLHAGRE